MNKTPSTQPTTVGPFNLQSGKVSKSSFESGGKTAHREQWFRTPPDNYFVEDSWQVQIVSIGGKNAYVRIVEFVRTAVDVTLPSGVIVQHAVVTAFRVVAHAETGSGYSAGAKTAWAEANISALMQEYV